MVAINIVNNIYVAFYKEADKRGYHYEDGAVDTPRLINETLRDKMEEFSK